MEPSLLCPLRVSEEREVFNLPVRILLEGGENTAHWDRERPESLRKRIVLRGENARVKICERAEGRGIWGFQW